MASFALALGTATQNQDGKIIEAYFPAPLLNPSDDLVSVLSALTDYSAGNQVLAIAPETCAAISEAFAAAGIRAGGKFLATGEKVRFPVVPATDGEVTGVETVGFKTLRKGGDFRSLER